MSQSLPPIGFWSYARQDDEEKLSRLRSILQRQLQRRFGREQIKIFQDVAAIPPGADWDQQIREAISTSTFFIPIITPNFLESEWCNQELMLFLERERYLDEQFPELAAKRVFPIYYIDITEVDAFDAKLLPELNKRQRTEFRDLIYEDDTQKNVLLRLDKIAETLCTLLRRDRRAVQIPKSPTGSVEPDKSSSPSPPIEQSDTRGSVTLATPTTLSSISTQNAMAPINWEQQPIVCLKTLQTKTLHFAFSPDGSKLVSSDGDDKIKFWDVTTGQPMYTFLKGAAGAYCFAFSPDSLTLSSGHNNGKIKLWDVASGKLLKTLSKHSEMIRCLAFNTDARTLASSGIDETIIWDVTSGEWTLTLPSLGTVFSVAFSPDGKILASADNNVTIFLDFLSAVVQRSTLRWAKNFLSLAFSPDGRMLATGSSDKNVEILDLTSKKLIHLCTGHQNFVTSVAFTPDGRNLASGSYDSTVKLWNVASGKLIRNLQGHGTTVTHVSFSPDGRLLASSSLDGTIKFWGPSSK